MSAALIGVIGVAAGALATGGVQAYLNSRDRRIEAVASIRLLWAEFRWVCIALNESLKAGGWPAARLLDPILEMWHEEKRTVSKALSNNEFARLAAALAQLRAIEFWAQKDKEFTWGRQKVELALVVCITARVIAYTAGESLYRRKWHRFRFGRALKREELYEPDVPPSQSWEAMSEDRRSTEAAGSGQGQHS